MAKIIGVHCDCGNTVRDNGTHCSCGRAYSPEVIELGREHHSGMMALVEANVPPDEGVRILAEASMASEPTMNPKGPGLFARIKYHITEFFVPKESTAL